MANDDRIWEVRLFDFAKGPSLRDLPVPSALTRRVLEALDQI
jgi:hypothetical protein